MTCEQKYIEMSLQTRTCTYTYMGFSAILSLAYSTISLDPPSLAWWSSCSAWRAAVVVGNLYNISNKKNVMLC